jgi:hypothetical protein
VLGAQCGGYNSALTFRLQEDPGSMCVVGPKVRIVFIFQMESGFAVSGDLRCVACYLALPSSYGVRLWWSSWPRATTGPGEVRGTRQNPLSVVRICRSKRSQEKGPNSNDLREKLDDVVFMQIILPFAEYWRAIMRKLDIPGHVDHTFRGQTDHLFRGNPAFNKATAKLDLRQRVTSVLPMSIAWSA